MRRAWNAVFLVFEGLSLGAVVTLSAAQVSTSSPTGVSFGKNIRISGDDPNGLNQNETAIAVNPSDSTNLVAVFQERVTRSRPLNCLFAFSTNSGRTWTLGGRGPLEKGGDFCFDPSITADAAGNFYFSYIDADLTVPGSDFDLVVAKSTDGGRTFATFSIAADNVPGDSTTPRPDKDIVTADTQPGSPFRGSLYLGYTNLTLAGVEVSVVVSGDAGTTWSTPTVIARQDRHDKVDKSRFGALPAIAADGSVYLFYSEFPSSFGTGPLSIRFARSTDGGLTWTVPADVASGLPSPGFFRLKNADPQYGMVPETGLVGITLPSAAAAPDGALFVAWVDFPQGACTLDGSDDPPCTNADVRLSVSRDGGTTWTLPVKVSDETNATDQFLPWIATHPDGRLSLVWQDRRLDASNVNYDTFYTNTLDGATFLPNVRVTSASSPLGTVNFIGDYNGLAVTADSIFPVWTDTRFGTPDVFVVRGQLRP